MSSQNSQTSQGNDSQEKTNPDPQPRGLTTGECVETTDPQRCIESRN